MSISFLKKVSSKESQKFIEKHLNVSTQDIILKYSGKTSLPLKEICEQIESTNKAIKKLPNLSLKNLIYRKLSLEQCSSEFSAFYKSTKISGKRIIDLTGGLGIDSIFFSKIFEELVYCELNPELSEIANYNFERLKIKNIKAISGDSIEELKNFPDNYFDWIFADPSRRTDEKRSVDIKYYTPDILKNKELLFSKSGNILLKLAPAFDIKEAERIFPEMNEFSVVSSSNECKEVLVILSKTKKDKIKSAVILDENFESVYLSDEIDSHHKIELETPIKEKYFYEPDVSIRKTGLTNFLANKLTLKKINFISDYVLSEKQINNFPGRSFKIEFVESYNEKNIKKYLFNYKIKKANISRNNFYIKPEEIKKKLGLKDGGEYYFFFTKDKDDKLIFISCKKI